MREMRFDTISKVAVYLEEDEYFLEVEGRVPGGTVIIPKIAIESLIYTMEIERLYGNNILMESFAQASVNMKVLADGDNSYIHFQADEKPLKEMTIAEIQKELGYKIKIKE